jgi:Voltage gated chloride channel
MKERPRRKPVSRLTAKRSCLRLDQCAGVSVAYAQRHMANMPASPAEGDGSEASGSEDGRRASPAGPASPPSPADQASPQHGVPEVMYAVNGLGGRMRPQVPIVKSLASAVCIGSGGSVGREGPIVQIGSALGSVTGQALRLPESQLRLLVACGAAGGISATFNAPIAGVFFALELACRAAALRRPRRCGDGCRARVCACRP